MQAMFLFPWSKLKPPFWKRGKAPDIKGLPPGSNPKPLPPPSGSNPNKLPAPGPEGSIVIDERTMLKKLMMEKVLMPEEKAEEIAELYSKYRQTLDPKYVESAKELLREHLVSLDPEAQQRVLENFHRTGRGVEVAERRLGRYLQGFVGDMGSQGLKAVGKRIPFFSIGIGLALAKERWDAGDKEGAVLELVSGILGSIPGIGTAGSLATDIYLAMRDMGIKVDRQTFDRMFYSALYQNTELSEEELKNLWNNEQERERILSLMQENPDFTVNLGGRRVRLDKDGNIYDYSALQEKGLGVNVDGQLYDRNTGRIVKEDPERFKIGTLR
jgi:hypothetical protein